MPRYASTNTADKKGGKGVARKTTWSNAVEQSVEPRNSNADAAEDQNRKGMASKTEWTTAVQRTTEEPVNSTYVPAQSKYKAKISSPNTSHQLALQACYIPSIPITVARPGDRPHDVRVRDSTGAVVPESPWTPTASVLSLPATEFPQASFTLPALSRESSSNPSQSNNPQIPAVVQPDSGSFPDPQRASSPTSPTAKMATSAKAAFRRLSITGRGNDDKGQKAIKSSTTPSGPVYVHALDERGTVANEMVKIAVNPYGGTLVDSYRNYESRKFCSPSIQPKGWVFQVLFSSKHQAEEAIKAIRGGAVKGGYRTYYLDARLVRNKI